MPQRPLDRNDPSVMFNVRLPGKTAERLRADARTAGETASTRLRRLIETDASYASSVREREKAHASYASSLEGERDRLRQEIAKLQADNVGLRQDNAKLQADNAKLRQEPKGKPTPRGAMDFDTFGKISKALHPDRKPTEKEREEAMKALTNWKAGAKRAGKS